MKKILYLMLMLAMYMVYFQLASEDQKAGEENREAGRED